MRTKTKVQVLPAAAASSADASLGRRLRAIVATRLEEILAEVAPTLKSFRMLLLVVTISIPLFMTGLIAALWHLGH